MKIAGLRPLPWLCTRFVVRMLALGTTAGLVCSGTRGGEGFATLHGTDWGRERYGKSEVGNLLSGLSEAGLSRGGVRGAGVWLVGLIWLGMAWAGVAWSAHLAVQPVHVQDWVRWDCGFVSVAMTGTPWNWSVKRIPTPVGPQKANPCTLGVAAEQELPGHCRGCGPLQGWSPAGKVEGSCITSAHPVAVRRCAARTPALHTTNGVHRIQCVTPTTHRPLFRAAHSAYRIPHVAQRTAQEMDEWSHLQHRGGVTCSIAARAKEECSSSSSSSSSREEAAWLREVWEKERRPDVGRSWRWIRKRQGVAVGRMVRKGDTDGLRLSGGQALSLNVWLCCSTCEDRQEERRSWGWRSYHPASRVGAGEGLGSQWREGVSEGLRDVFAASSGPGQQLGVLQWPKRRRKGRQRGTIPEGE